MDGFAIGFVNDTFCRFKASTCRNSSTCNLYNQAATVSNSNVPLCNTILRFNELAQISRNV